MNRYLRLWIVIVIIVSTNVIWAQPPGGGDRPGGRLPLDGTPNVEIPDIEDIELDSQSGIDVDVQSEAIMATAQARQAGVTIPFDADTFSDKMDNFEVPEDWSQMATLINEMPSKDEIMAMADELPLDNLDLASLDIQLESSPAATSAIVGYASSMLGLKVTPLYAGEYGDDEIAGSEAAKTTLDVIYSLIGPDMQSLLTQADSLSGVAYWALLDDGLALVYTGDCELDECSIQQDMVQVEITGGSAGVYALYSTISVSSADEAKALVQNTFPYLATLDLSETETSAGIAFFAYNVNMETSQVTAYYAGVYESNGLSVVYAVSGVGDAYINVLLGGG